MVEEDCFTSALSWAKKIAQMQLDSVMRSRGLINTNVATLERRLEAERLAFVEQIQTRQAIDGIDNFLRRQEHV